MKINVIVVRSSQQAAQIKAVMFRLTKTNG